MAGVSEHHERRRRRGRWRWLLVVLVVAALAVGLADRSASDAVVVGTPQRLIVVNTAGPVEVRAVDGDASVHHRDSWILSRPLVEASAMESDVVVRVSCSGRGPCRSSVVVDAPIGIELVVVSSGVVTVPSFDGSLTVLAENDRVALGPIRGSARVVAHSDVIGTALAADQFDASTVEGELVLDVATAPSQMFLVGSTEPIMVDFPDDAVYDVTIEAAGGDVTIDLPEPGVNDDPVLVVARTAGEVTMQRRQLPETPLDVDS